MKLHYRCGRCGNIYLVVESDEEEEREGLCEFCMTEAEKQKRLDLLLAFLLENGGRWLKKAG